MEQSNDSGEQKWYKPVAYDQSNQSNTINYNDIIIFIVFIIDIIHVVDYYHGQSNPAYTLY